MRLHQIAKIINSVDTTIISHPPLREIRSTAPPETSTVTSYSVESFSRFNTPQYLMLMGSWPCGFNTSCVVV